MKGSVYKRCGCRDPKSGKHLHGKCPRLKQKNHGGWWVRYDAPPSLTGKRRQPMLGPFHTKDQAEAELAKILLSIGAGAHVDVDRSLTVAVDFDRWLDGQVTLKDSTRREHESIGGLYIKPGIGHLHPIDLREHHIEDLYASMRQIGRLNAGQRRPETLCRLLDADRHAAGPATAEQGAHSPSAHGPACLPRRRATARHG